MEIITITEAAAERLHEKMDSHNPRAEAVLVSVTTKGCSGMSYDLQFLPKLADAPKGSDVVESQGLTVVIDPKALLHIIGSTMDYKTDAMRSGFDFINPNETARCGCGESFSVAQPASKG